MNNFFSRGLSSTILVKSIFTSNPFSNKFLVGATGIVIGLQLLAVYNPFFQKVLRTVPLDGKDWAIIVVIAFSVILVEEFRKMVKDKFFFWLK